MVRCAVFDLDGTVLNTLGGLADAGNYALSCLGFPTYPEERYRFFVGNGIPKLIERILPEGADQEAFEKAHHLFRSYYSKNMNNKTVPYDGIPEVLRQLKQSGVRLVLVSNKAHEFTKSMVEHAFGDLFDLVFGSTEDKPKKPDPYWVLHALGILKVKPEEAFYIGDSGVDMQTAKNAGIPACGVLWGFRDKKELLENGADFLCGDCRELPALILS